MERSVEKRRRPRNEQLENVLAMLRRDVTPALPFCNVAQAFSCAQRFAQSRFGEPHPIAPFVYQGEVIPGVGFIVN